MRRVVALLLWLCLPVAGAAQTSLAQHQSETTAPLADVVQALESQLAADVSILSTADAATFSYVGTDMPVALIQFLKAAFPDLDTAPLLPGAPVSLSVALQPTPDGTHMSLLIEAAFAARSSDYPAGAKALLDGRTGPCAGQTVLMHHQPLTYAAPLYRAYLQNQGFALEHDPDASVSFSSGYRPGCSVFLYLQADTPEQTLIVLRFLED